MLKQSKINNDQKKEFKRQRDIIYSYFKDYRLIIDNKEDKAFQNLISHYNAYNNLERV